LLAVVSVCLWAITFALLGSGYREAFRGTVANNVYYLALGLEFLRDMFVKSAPLWLLLSGAFLLRPKTSRTPAASPLARDTLALGTFGLLIAAPLAFAASCKLGASAYYYFTTLLMLSLVAAGLIATLACTRLVLASLGLAAGLQGLVLSGHVGKIDLAVAAGYFRALLLPSATGAEYDGGSLRHYDRGESVGNVTVYRRKPDPLP
jgi:hypothetical protein